MAKLKHLMKIITHYMRDKAEYNKKLNLLNSFGTTKIITSQNYVFESKNVEFDNNNKIIKSDFNTKIIDPDGNIIEVKMFNYNSIKNVLFSRGEIILKDKNKNEFLFSEIYIDEKVKRLLVPMLRFFLMMIVLKQTLIMTLEYLQTAYPLVKV